MRGILLGFDSIGEKLHNSMPMTDTQPQTPINFTDAAARKVKELIDEEENTQLNLRVFITGGWLFRLSIRLHFR